MASSFCGHDVERTRDACFSADLRMCTLGDMRIVACTGRNGAGRRTAHHVRSQSERLFGIQVVRFGEELVVVGDASFRLIAGSVLFWDSAAVGRFDVPGELEKASVVIPETVLRERLGRSASLFSRTIDAGNGIGAVLRSHVVALADNMMSFDSDDLTMQLVTVDLVAAALRRRDEAPLAVVPRVSLERIQAYMLSQLKDPDLTPSKIARENGTSLRRLHALFHGAGTTVLGWLKEQRLLRCREALATSDADHETVYDVASRFGFNDLSNFSRSFRLRFEHSPGTCRSR